MKRIFFIQLALALATTGVWAQCDIKLEERMKTLLAGPALVQTYVELDGFKSSKSSCLLNVGTTYRLTYITSEKYKGVGHVVLGSQLDSVFLEQRKSEIMAKSEFTDASLNIITSSRSMASNPHTLTIVFSVQKTGVYQVLIKSVTANTLCALWAIENLNIVPDKYIATHLPPPPPNPTFTNVKVDHTPTLDGGKVIYTVVEQMPQFTKTDGLENLHKWVAANLIYPAEMKKNNISGRVYVQFVVSEDGKVINPQVLRGLSTEADQCVFDLINKMPAWEVPGKQNGKNVSIYFTMPINFTMEKAKVK
jgi:TonB family protein